MSGKAPRELAERYQRALNIYKKDNSKFSEREAAEFALVFENHDFAKALHKSFVQSIEIVTREWFGRKKDNSDRSLHRKLHSYIDSINYIESPLTYPYIPYKLLKDIIFDTLISKKNYEKPGIINEIIKYLERNIGSKFPPDLEDVFYNGTNNFEDWPDLFALIFTDIVKSNEFLFRYLIYGMNRGEI